MNFRGTARRPFLEYDFQGDGLFRIGSNETVRSPEFPEEREEGGRFVVKTANLRSALRKTVMHAKVVECGQQFPKASVRVIEHAKKEGRFAGNACVTGIFFMTPVKRET